MKLLICTQKVSLTDSNLGSFHRWISEFAKHCEQVSVICLEEGRHELPANVHVYSLGKERGTVSRVQYAFRFWRQMWRLRGQYDAVFVHMNPEYLIMGGGWWRITHKRVVLWYTHKSVNLRLRIGAFFASVICTASKESFRLSSNKVQVVGHGIDTTLFSGAPRHDGRIRMITTGRMSRTKRVLEMLAVCDVLYARELPFQFDIAGTHATADDIAYELEVRRALATKPYREMVQLLGAVPHAQIPLLLSEHTVCINLSATGSFDKAVLEAICVGLAPVSSNEAFRDLLSPYGLYVADGNPEQLADAIVRAAVLDISALRAKVVAENSLSALIARIVGILSL